MKHKGGGSEEKRGRKINLEEQKKDRGVAVVFRKDCRAPGAQRWQTWPSPRLELVDRNLMSALTSEPHSRKEEEEGMAG